MKPPDDKQFLQQLRGSSLDRAAVAQAELDETSFGLVRDCVAIQLRNDWIPQRLRRVSSRLHVVDEALGSDGNSVLSEQRLGIALGQRRVRAGVVGGHIS